MALPDPKRPSEQELTKEYLEMMLMIKTSPDWQQKLEARILAKGRTEMHHLLTWLFVRCTMMDIELFQCKQEQEQQRGRV